MKIIDLQVRTVAIPLNAQLRHNTGVHPGYFLRTVLELITDEGIVGLGDIMREGYRAGLVITLLLTTLYVQLPLIEKALLRQMMAARRVAVIACQEHDRLSRQARLLEHVQRSLDLAQEEPLLDPLRGDVLEVGGQPFVLNYKPVNGGGKGRAVMQRVNADGTIGLEYPALIPTNRCSANL